MCRFLLLGVLSVALVGCGSNGDRAVRQTGTGATAAPSGSYVWTQDCGVTAYEHAPHNPQLANDPSYDADEYLELSLQEARARAEANGLEVRVLGKDGDCEGRTDDARRDRVNFYVEDQSVAAAARY